MQGAKPEVRRASMEAKAAMRRGPAKKIPGPDGSPPVYCTFEELITTPYQTVPQTEGALKGLSPRMLTVSGERTIGAAGVTSGTGEELND